MTAETRRIAAKAIDAAVGGDRVEYLNRDINQLYDLNTLSRIRREGY